LALALHVNLIAVSNASCCLAVLKHLHHEVARCGAVCAQVDTCLAKHATDNVTAIVVCFSADPPPPRSIARGRGPSRSLSRDGLSTLSSALASASSQPVNFLD
jgi:protein phosphatase 2C family protein 2/3